MADDPFEWDVDRVVKELCTTERTWTPRPRGKLPDPEKLEERLREGEVDGETLLGSLDDASFWVFLGVVNPKIKFSVVHAVKQLQHRSPIYQQYAASLRPPDDSPAADTLTRKTPHGKKSGKDHASNGHLTLQESSNMQEPPKKKQRRLALADISTVEATPRDVRFGVTEILTEADIITAPLPQSQAGNPQRASSRKKGLPLGPSDDPHAELFSSPGAFFGNGSMELQNFVSMDPADDGDQDWGWAIPKPFATAQILWVHCHMKRYLRDSRAYHGIDDDEESVLPLLGDSDEEDNPDPVWDNIHREIEEEAEEVEREKALQAKTDLTLEQVEACLQSMVEEHVARWQESKLPIQERRAFTIWNKARRQGNRTKQVLDLEKSLLSATARLNKVLDTLKDNAYQSEKELRFVGAHLEPPVFERERIKWTISTLKSPTAPPKITSKAAPKPRTKKYATDPDDGGFDIWEDEEDDFIVDDDPDGLSLEETSSAQTNSKGLFDQSLAPDPSQPADRPDSTLTQSFASVSDVSMYDLTEVNDEDSPVVDLCTPAKSKATTPTPQSHALDKSDIDNGKDMDLSMDDKKRLVAEVFDSWTMQKRKRINDIISFTETAEQLWTETIEDSMEMYKADSGPLAKTKSHREAVISLARLFDLYTNGPRPVAVEEPSKTKSNGLDLGSETPKRIRSRKDRCGAFLSFMKELANRDMVDSDGDDDDDNANADADKSMTPSKKEKKMNLKASAKIRRIEHESIKVLAARRDQFRLDIEKSGLLSKAEARLVINESKMEGQGLVFVHPSIAGRIQDHQVDGVRFMWDHIIGTKHQGCLLAHTMGLGKTMQVITLLVAIREAATSSDDTISCQVPSHLKTNRVLVLCPAGILTNWVDEIKHWAPPGALGDLYYVESLMGEDERVNTIRTWANKGGILVIGYSLVRRFGGKHEDLLTTLLEKPTLVVADEAHNFKNIKSKLGTAAKLFETRSRIALTGSPLSNNVEEYYAMVDWISPNYLGLPSEFSSKYSIPIKQGLWKESSPVDRRKARVRLEALKTVVASLVHRKTSAVLKDSLPPKVEFMIHVALEPFTKTVYQTYVAGTRSQVEDSTVTSVWALVAVMRLLLAHPSLVQKTLNEPLIKGKPRQKVESPSSDDGDPITDGARSAALPALRDLFNKNLSVNDEVSHKMVVLEKILDESLKVGDNVLVFSQSIPTLDYIEAKLCRDKQRAYKRIDGSVQPARRQGIVKSFGSGQSQVFLISTTAGGVGLNIHSANRVVFIDFKYNPMHEQQAVGRAYRIGQTKPVFVYWLICRGTFEEKMLNQQVFKNQLFSRLVDSKHPDSKAKMGFSEWFNDYQEPERVDTSEFRGMDVVMDALLADPQASRGVTSLLNTDTFEEEEADKELDASGQAEAEQLVSLLLAVKNFQEAPASQGQGSQVVQPGTGTQWPFPSGFPPTPMAVRSRTSSPVPAPSVPPNNRGGMPHAAQPGSGIMPPGSGIMQPGSVILPPGFVQPLGPPAYNMSSPGFMDSYGRPLGAAGYHAMARVPQSGYPIMPSGAPVSQQPRVNPAAAAVVHRRPSATTMPLMDYSELNRAATAAPPTALPPTAPGRGFEFPATYTPLHPLPRPSNAVMTNAPGAVLAPGKLALLNDDDPTKTEESIIERLTSALKAALDASLLVYVEQRWREALEKMKKMISPELPRRLAWRKFIKLLEAFPEDADALQDGYGAEIMRQIADQKVEAIHAMLWFASNKRQFNSKKGGKDDPNHLSQMLQRSMLNKGGEGNRGGNNNTNNSFGGGGAANSQKASDMAAVEAALRRRTERPVKKENVRRVTNPFDGPNTGNNSSTSSAASTSQKGPSKKNKRPDGPGNSIADPWVLD